MEKVTNVTIACVVKAGLKSDVAQYTLSTIFGRARGPVLIETMKLVFKEFSFIRLLGKKNILLRTSNPLIYSYTTHPLLTKLCSSHRPIRVKNPRSIAMACA